MRSVAWLLAAPILEVGLSSNAHERDSSRAPLYLGYCRSIAAKTTAEDYETEATTLPFAWKSHAMTDHQRQFILEWQVTDTRKKKDFGLPWHWKNSQMISFAVDSLVSLWTKVNCLQSEEQIQSWLDSFNDLEWVWSTNFHREWCEEICINIL